MSHPSWPSFVWQTYDYYFDPTAAYFGCKKACEPIHIQWNAETDQIEVVNYRAGHRSDLIAKAQLLNQQGEIKWEQQTSLSSVPEDQTVTCFALPQDDATLSQLSDTYFVRLYLTDAQGQTLSDNFYWQGKQEGNYTSLLSLPKAQLSIETETQQVGDEWLITGRITNPGQTPALMIHLTAETCQSHQRITPVLYNDNYFFLMPGESKDLRISMKVADSHGEKPVVVEK